MSLLFFLMGVSLGGLAYAQQTCPTNPCLNGGECYLKPDGKTPYCYCQVNYEGELCGKFNRPRTGCLQTQRNFYGQKNGSISSPNYPADYPTKQSCAYFIGTPDATKFEITFHDLSVEDSKDELSLGAGNEVDLLNYDYLYDKSAYNPLPGPLVLDGDRVWFNFYSDFNVNEKGFRLTWRVDGDECIGNTCGPEETCVDGEYAYTCEGGATGGGEGHGATGGSAGGAGSATGGFTGGAEGGAGGATGGGEGHGATGGSAGGAEGGATGGFTGGAEGGATGGSAGGAEGGATGGFTGGAEGGAGGATGGGEGHGATGGSTGGAEGGATGGFTGGAEGGAGGATGGTEGGAGGDAGGNNIANGGVDNNAWSCNVENEEYEHGAQWDPNICSYCNCNNGTAKCQFRTCPPVRCRVPIRDATVCCHSCPPPRFIVKQVNFTWGANSGSIISHKSNARKVNVNIGYDQDRSSLEISGRGLWKMSTYATMKAEAGGGRISASEQILDKRKAKKKVIAGDNLKFNKLAYNLDLTDRRCEDIEEMCVVFSKGDDPSPDFEFVPEPNPSILTSCQTPECPPPPPGVTCMDETSGTEYQDGQEWNPDLCTSCTCHSGHSDCITQECPVLDCAETKPVEGQCCPQCLVEDRGTCVYEGETRESGLTWSISDCVNCHCDAGSISCEIFGCTCPATPEELMNCGGYQNGESWYESKCIKCTCTEGTIECVSTSCPTLECAEIVQGETDCCPRCIDDPPVPPLPCRQGEQSYYHGQVWKLSDCITCACSNGLTSCAPTKCEAVDCENPKIVEGECCLACPNDTKKAGQPCLQNNRLYTNGDSWDLDVCTSCKCDNTLVACASIACGIPLCPGKIIYDDPTTCCPYCDDTDVGFCTYKDVEYPNGAEWKPDPCLSCSCELGLVQCLPWLCLAVHCREYAQLPDECCPSCVGEPIPQGCEDKESGKEYVHGETHSPDPCTTCQCNNGLLFCTAKLCDLIAGCSVNLVTLPDQCCPICPELVCTDPSSGLRYENGEHFKPDPCSSCICQDGLILCSTALCSALPPTCTTSYTPEGECCPVCFDTEILEPGCMDRGREYVSGQQWRPEPCQFCTCINGSSICSTPACDLPCTNPEPPVPGQCCGSCPDDPRCVDDGLDYAHGETWQQGECKQCVCIRGSTICTTKQCSVPLCDNPVTQPGHCCPSCPPTEIVGLPCTYKGNTYQSGEQFQKSPCESCHCNDGYLHCVAVSCEPVSCSNAFVGEGKCCLECPAEPCITKSGIKADGAKWKVDDCTSCECNRGAATCETQTCPELTCVGEKVPGACCEQCPGDVPCLFKGKTYVKGQRFQPAPCEFCTCLGSGGVGCVPASCPYLTCPNPVRKEGECCASCVEEGKCEYEGKEYPAGKAFNPSPCVSCKCSDTLSVSCNLIVCDVPTCPNPVLLEGACCASCEDTFCNYEGNIYPNGATFQKGECGTCTCENGGIACVGTSCRPLDCSVESIILTPGQCCPTCQEATPSCTYRNDSYPEGARWRVDDCLDCWCEEGRVYCAGIACLDLQDCNTVEKEEGECCPVCKDPQPLVLPRECTDNGLKYQDGSRWYSNCGYCSCLSGVVSCTDVICPSLTCPEQVKTDGSCCPTCVVPDDSRSCRLFGNTYQHRAVFHFGSCQDCMCYDSAIYCWSRVCRKPDCDNPIQVPGKCCPECPAVGPALRRQECSLPDGRRYSHGTFFQTDPCVFCYCYNGNVICSREPCEAKACDDQGEVTLPGHCCSKCRSEIKKCIVDGVTYSHDERWRIGQCKECSCFYGVAQCTDLVCPAIACSDPVTEEGTCCPRCPDDPVGTPCSFEGMEYTDGQEWRLSKCVTCACFEGTVKCEADPCPPLACHNPLTIKGECCRLCPDDAKPCEVDGKIYDHGESYRSSDCLDCTCNNGIQTCNQKTCPALSCRSSDAFMVEGECCPQCTGLNKRPCTVDGVKYSDGQQWLRGDCETCRCDQGQMTCTFPSCPALSCENSTIPKGECCPKCPADTKSCSIEGGEVSHGEFGMVRSADRCDRCGCSNGELSCLVENCPAVCENATTSGSGCCPSCPNMKTCMYNGYEFVNGQTWQKDTCTFCQCVHGGVLCDPEICPELTCTETVEVDGECCPRCKDEAKVCSYGGTEYEHGASFSSDECSRCTCDNGAVGCTYQNCPPVTCSNPTKEPGQCCEQCPGDPRPCDTPKGVFSHGETWQQSDCITCTCDDGSENCEMEQCPVLTCADARKVTGECCRKCPDETRPCSVNGVLYKHKEQWQPTLCRSCQCDDGTVDCTDQTCPELTCPEPLETGETCCPVCPGEPARKTCQVDNQVYSHRQEWKVDDCTSCSCNDGLTTCSSENCPPLQCQQGEGVAQEGQCCKICPEEAQSCEVNGATYEHGKNWRDGDCSLCRCENGQVTCDFELCKKPLCDNPIKVPGKCCLQCPDVIPARDCQYKNNFYPHSYRWNPDVCSQCNCNDGTVGCKGISCPEIFCGPDEEVYLEGECCPLCPDQTKPCVEAAGAVRQHGDRWPISDCTRCTCFNSDVSCDTQLCPKPLCQNVIPVEGECCDTCSGLPALKNTCVYRGREYVDGEWWKVDDCKSCTCTDGITSCSFESCPRLICEGEPILEEGKCCPICPADAKSCMLDGVMYEHGATWNSSVCTDCSCNNGMLSCSQEVCVAPSCEDTEDVGQCCQQCKGDPPFKRCSYQGKEYKHGYVLRKNDCKSCTCEDGSFNCRNELCPALNCTDPITIQGECCKRCPADAESCEVDGTTYKHGDRWSDGPCSDCQCDDGSVSCDVQACPTPDCNDAAVLDGECCPTCPGIVAPYQACRAGNQKYRHGEWWNPTDCAQCTCMDGDVFCQTETCPRLTCDDPVAVEGECCKKCPDETKVCQLDGNGDVRAHRETWRVDNCQTCTCSNGKVSCDTQTCPALDCAEASAEVPENQCCPVCPEAVALTAKSCEVDGQTYQHSQRWDTGPCKSCMCNNGKVTCESPPCDTLTCTNPMKVAGECCMRCPEDARSCTTADNKEYAHGETWSDGDCKTCTCNNGRKDCEETQCPALTCSNPITVPGQCCKQCEERPFETCIYNGKEYKHGSHWDSSDSCKSCSCSDGRADCETPTCPALTCADPVKVKGQCCRVCVDDYGTCVASDGTKRNHGEAWQVSDCVTCTCNDGTTSCNTIKCPALDCTNGIRDPGQCCPRCPTDPAPLTCHVQGGVEYISGQSWTKGKCRTCTCDSGNKLCQTDTCSALNCPDPETVANECCKRCPEDIPVCLAGQGVSYKHGETWKSGDCKTCECKEGAIICTDKLCPQPDCDNPVDVEGKCCPQCPGVPVPKACQMGHVTRAHGDTWQETPCKSCSCSNGRVDCESVVCTTLTCADTVHVEGECCRRCKDDTKDCPSDTGSPYKHGQSWQPDPCTSCNCYDGSADCTSTICHPVDCDNPITSPSECCPRCPGDRIPVPCQYEGAEVAHGDWWRIDSCKFCQCKSGIVSCASETCPQLTCPNSVKVPGQCCRTCIDEPDSGCTVGGRRLKTGDTFRQSPCSTCTCFFGSLECDLTICNMPTCDNPVKEHDECCPRCIDEPVPAACSVGGNTYRSGESWSKGPCKTCFCENGKASCESKQCPVLDCPNPITLVDECCTKCPSDLQSCMSGNTTYDHATSFKRGDCKTCSCDNAVITCQTELCLPLDCPEPLMEEGQCCGKCPGDKVTKACTTKTGEKMRHGQTWRQSPCKVCTCDDGNIRCDKETCPPLDCEQPLKRAEGKCCRQCPPDPANACTAEDGTVYMPREKWNPDVCSECECTEQGGVRCTTEDCPALDCPDPTTVEGQCCMTCDPTALVKPGTSCTPTRQEGDTWNPTPCATCTCTQGEISCEVETCKSLDCTDVVKNPGECCARCESDAKCRDATGKARRQGEFWRSDRCEECTCDNGETVCRPITCTAEPTCNNPQVVDGNCCPTCPGIAYKNCDVSPTRSINHGESLKVDDCNTCTCNEGKQDCRQEVCPAIDCERPMKREGECCSECPVLPGEGDCTFEGATYRTGETFEDPADKCLRCLCSMSEIVCGQQGTMCPPTDCAAPIIPEGECCPTCIDGVCEYENKLYQHGERWDPTDCEFCECNAGTVACGINDCVPVPCSSELVKVEGRCCPECPDDFRSCMDKVGMYSHGQRWTKADDVCVGCFCDDSAICCEHIQCPTPECQEPVTPVGECCPVCGVLTMECSYKNATYMHGERFEEDCSNCECVHGHVTCNRIGCDPLPCANPQQLEGECCPTCGEPCFHRNVEHQDGEEWQDGQPCVLCSCTDGLVRCGVKSCPPLRCRDATVKTGDCCATCPDISFERSRLELFGTVNNYGLNFLINIANVEKVIEGDEIWRVRLWSAARSNGGGAKTAVVKQALNKEQSSRSIGLTDRLLRFDGLEYARDLGGRPCETFRYVCAEFFMTRVGYEHFTTSTPFGESISTICLNACA